MEWWMWNVECRMWNVECRMWDLEWGMRHGNVLPQIADEHRNHAGCFIKKTRDSAKPLRPTEGNCTDAHGWVFSRIGYSCSAAYRLVLMRSRRNGLPRIFSHAESCVGEGHARGLLGMRKICGNPRDLWATTKRAMR